MFNNNKLLFLVPATCDCCTVMLVFRFMRRVYRYNAHLLSRGKQSIGLFSYRSPSSPVGGFAGKIKTQYPNRVSGFYGAGDRT